MVLHNISDVGGNLDFFVMDIGISVALDLGKVVK